MKINSITNVSNTLNARISFLSGTQTNYEIYVPPAKDNMVEGGLLTGFFGTVIPLITNNVHSRAKSIEDGLKQSRLDIEA